MRCVGRLSKEKLEITRKSNAIVEDLLEPLRPSQYFAAVFESNSSLDTKLSELLHDQIMVYSVKSTGLRETLELTERWRRSASGIITPR